LQIFGLSHPHNGSSHWDKTNAYGAWVIHYDIQLGNLNNMEQEFHLLISKCWFIFCIWALWFFGMLNIELQIWMGNVQYTINHQHKYFPSTPGHLKIVKLMNHWNQMVVVERILLHKIKFKSQNKYPWTRKIHTIKRMGIFVCT
jgi:hypothetical protein